nr:hypothetical protein [Tanacetum cinerariifolium]GFB80992.1 hypothetical protein [Tanacetum cinerariifolium]
ETSSAIKLEDLTKLVSHVQPSFKDLDSPKHDHVIIVNDSDEDEDDEVHAIENIETEDTLVPKSSSPWIKKVKKFDFVIEDGKHVHLIEEQINQQKKIEEEVKAEEAKQESEVRKEELIDLLGPELAVPAEVSLVQQLVMSLNLEGRPFSSVGKELLKS